MNTKILASIGLGMAIAMLGATSSAFAASEAQKAQQAKFGECSHEAKTKGLKGNDFKAFMKSCASGSSSTSSAGAAPAPAAKPTAVQKPTAATTAPAAAPADKRTTQQDRMKQCNGDAKTKGLSGDARKTFMKSCLTG